MAAVAAPLGLCIGWSVNYGLLACMAFAVTSYMVTRKRGFIIALLAYAVTLVFLWGIVIVDVSVQGPYVRAYNERLEKTAIDPGLVGDNEARVEAVLGPATGVYSGWNRWDMETGIPTPDAKYWTTYNYAPYPSFPSAKFQVHCIDGIVQSIELYDD